jgi:predicted DNA-binding protein
MKKTFYGIRLTDNQMIELKEWSKQCNIPISVIIRKAINRYIDENKKVSFSGINKFNVYEKITE